MMPEVMHPNNPNIRQSNTESLAGTRRRWVFIVPLIVFIGLGMAFWRGLSQDPRFLPSTLIGKPAPTFNLPPVKGRSRGLSDRDLLGEVSMVNVFASWCTACRAEHPLFMKLEASGKVPIHGLNYKDKPDDASAWLDELGDPYTRTGADIDGRVGIDWGVYGVPETFVINRDGKIMYKHIGAITPTVLEKTILPLIERLNNEQK